MLTSPAKKITWTRQGPWHVVRLPYYLLPVERYASYTTASFEDLWRSCVRWIGCGVLSKPIRDLQPRQSCGVDDASPMMIHSPYSDVKVDTSCVCHRPLFHLV